MPFCITNWDENLKKDTLKEIQISRVIFEKIIQEQMERTEITIWEETNSANIINIIQPKLTWTLHWVCPFLLHFKKADNLYEHTKSQSNDTWYGNPYVLYFKAHTLEKSNDLMQVSRSSFLKRFYLNISNLTLPCNKETLQDWQNAVHTAMHN